MLNLENKKNNLEILISTTKKNNLDFIERIFFENNYENFPILIVNQSQSPLKNCAKENIKIINSDSTGISNSRNLALENSSEKYCLFADDDIVYKKGFYELVLKEFEQNKYADVITFMMEDEDGNLFKDYTNISKHNKKSIREVNSVVIAFRRDVIIKNNIQFDPLFGLGGTFATGDEYIFLRNCLDKNLNLIFCRKVILKHDLLSSGKLVFRDENIFARAAIFYKFYGYLSYIKLVHHIYLLWKKNLIKFNQIFDKFLAGLRGIKKFKSI